MIDTVFHIYNKEGCVSHNLSKSELKEKILKDEIPLDDIIEIMPVYGDEEMSDASY
jgi:hypothetical protein